MAVTWNPGIFKNGVFSALPTPAKVLNLAIDWDVHKSKTPLADGILTTGHSLNAMRFSIAGALVKNAAKTKIFEDVDIVTAFENLKVLLNVDTDSDKYQTFILNDAPSETFRSFKSCYAENLVFGYGDNDRAEPTYSCDIVAENPNMFSTAPGD